MRILFTGILVFLLWAAFSSWLYVSKIKPACNAPAVTTAPADTLTVVPVPEIPKPGNFTLYFEFNKSVIKSNLQTDQLVKQFPVWMEKHPDARMEITGHADNKGSDAYNLKLGMARAESARDYLKVNGIPAEKIAISSKGESSPAADNSTEDGRSKNRRTEITLK